MSEEAKNHQCFSYQLTAKSADGSAAAATRIDPELEIDRGGRLRPFGILVLAAVLAALAYLVVRFRGGLLRGQ